MKRAVLVSCIIGAASILSSCDMGPSGPFVSDYNSVKRFTYPSWANGKYIQDVEAFDKNIKKNPARFKRDYHGSFMISWGVVENLSSNGFSIDLMDIKRIKCNPRNSAKEFVLDFDDGDQAIIAGRVNFSETFETISFDECVFAKKNNESWDQKQNLRMLFNSPAWKTIPKKEK